MSPIRHLCVSFHDIWLYQVFKNINLGHFGLIFSIRLIRVSTSIERVYGNLLKSIWFGMSKDNHIVKFDFTHFTIPFL